VLEKLYKLTSEYVSCVLAHVLFSYKVFCAKQNTVLYMLHTADLPVLHYHATWHTV